MLWASFHCESPDFFVRSILDNIQYGVKRSCLGKSEVFRDMFACCDMGYGLIDDADLGQNQILDLHESSEALILLLRLLHFPPAPPTPYPDEPDEKMRTCIRVRRCVPSTIIPLPLLPSLFGMAEKYALPEETVDSLLAHFKAHAPTQPLQVYAYAIERSWLKIAAKTSKYLLHPPLASYNIDEIKVIPNVEAYHQLVLLHDFRIKQLRSLLLAEAIFPHGYGSCPSHSQKTNDLWRQAQSALAPKVEAGTDVAAEMASVAWQLEDCQACQKACTAAVEMLAYKCRRVPRTVDKLPDVLAAKAH